MRTISLQKRNMMMSVSQCAGSAPELVLEELNHRFLNSLQIIASLAHMQPQETASAPAVRERMGRLRDCISALGRLHRHLARPVMMPFEDAAAEICGAVAEAFGRPVQVSVSVDQEPADVSLSRGLQLMLAELMTNAVKHSRAERLSVGIELLQTWDGWVLRVGSNTQATSGTPRVAAALATWLGGELTVDRGQGFAVTVSLPVAARAALPFV